VTVIPARLVEKHRIQPTTTKLLAANGTRIPLLGVAKVHGLINNTPIEISGLVSEHVMDVMLGFDWLHEHQAKWDFVSNQIVIAGVAHRLCEKRDKATWCRRVIVDTDIVIPPESQRDITTKVVYNYMRQEPEEDETAWSTEPSEVKHGLLVARSILPNRAVNLPVRVMNVTKQPICLCRGTSVSDVNPVQPLTGSPTKANVGPERSTIPTEQPVIEEMMSRVDSSVPEDIRNQLRKILMKRSNVFSQGEWDLGWTDLVAHKIDTGDHPPIRQQLRRYPPSHLQAIDEHLETMLGQGVIEPASSPWSSNVVLAKKKDGSLRCCIDFRQINEITKKDAYPLPKTDQCLDALNGSSWY